MISQLFNPDNYQKGVKLSDEYLCNQVMFVRKQSDGTDCFHWSLLNVVPEELFNKNDPE